MRHHWTMSPAHVDDAYSAAASSATTLAERIAGLVKLEVDPGKSAKRLSRWSELVSRGDPNRFEQRLRLDGLNLEAAPRIAGKARWDGPLPDWSVFVVEALERAGDADLDEDRALTSAGEQIVPLQELVIPFARVARSRLAARVGERDAAIGSAVLPALERELVAQLGALFSPVADLEFRLWRRGRVDPLREVLVRAHGNPGRELYYEWVAELRNGRLGELLEEYSVLARRAATIARGWVDATAEFLAHLAADRESLAERFGEGASLGRVIAIGGASSDPHRGRRRVVGCTFDSGVKLVYKPRGLRTEVVYGELLEWLNRHGAEPELRALGVLDRGDHGWVEFAAHGQVEDEDGARRFYRRGGMLLALLYSLGGNDCHMENLVAAGENPVVVDVETVLHPTLLSPEAASGQFDAFQAAVEATQSSVLSVGLLPAWMLGAEGRALDVSGLGAVEPQEGLEPVRRWEHPNTDVARLVLERPVLDPQANVLRVGGRALRPEDYAEDLCAGVIDAYGVLLRGRGELLGSGGPLVALEEAPVRVVFGSTRVYGHVVEAASQPRHLREGIDFSIELELLRRPLLDGSDPAAFWELHRREQEQLEATDIPFFTARAGAEALYGDDGAPVVRFRRSAVETARRRLAALSSEDERTQVVLLRATLGTRSRPEPRPRVQVEDVIAPGSDVALRAALAHAEDLDATAVRAGEGVAWVGLSLGDEAERWALQPTAYDLYEGGPGIAVFLSALARATGDERWRELALGALTPLLDEAERHPGRLAVLRGIGGATGFGGIVYALALVAELTGEERAVEAARALIRALPAAAIERDPAFDLLGGAAGTLAGILAFDRVSGGYDHAVELGRVAGRVLARNAVLGAQSAVWRTSQSRSLDGFAHGTAGIALVLARLAMRTGDDTLVALARSAVGGESDRFDPSLGGWPDRRDEGEQTLMHGWCHGSAGIGHARLGLLETPLGTELEGTIARDLERASAAVTASQPSLDHLCCGGAGESEFLLDLARVRGDDVARGVAEERCDAMARRILAEESPRLHGPAQLEAREVPRPGLFQGTSGVGLALLRRMRPDLPSVLLWR